MSRVPCGLDAYQPIECGVRGLPAAPSCQWCTKAEENGGKCAGQYPHTFNLDFIVSVRVDVLPCESEMDACGQPRVCRYKRDLDEGLRDRDYVLEHCEEIKARFEGFRTVKV